MSAITVRSPDGSEAHRVHELRYWSPVLGEDVVRLSVYDGRGGEFWMEVPERDGQSWRTRRWASVLAMVSAIDQQLDPGEVRVL